MRVSEITISKLTKRYGEVVAVDSLDLHIKEGDMVTLLGPSGCGKTTTLRCIAGLETADDGEIRIGRELMNKGPQSVPPEKRGVGMMFQSYALWPHLTVFDNVGYPLKLKRIPSGEIQKRVHAVLEMVGLGEMSKRFPSQLSGGQQQRVALARSVVAEPQVLLFDEPLSNLDAKLRERMRFELRLIQKKVNITAVYVTHDQSEAMTISDVVVVMRHGKIVQMGSPQEIYETPVNRYVAEFIGLMSFFDGVVGERNLGLCEVLLSDGIRVKCRIPENVPQGAKVQLGIRPESAELVSGQGDPTNQWRMPVDNVTYLGDRVNLDATLGPHELRIQVAGKHYSDMMGATHCNLYVDPLKVIYLPE